MKYEDLKDLHERKMAYIVGKGPSLQYLTPEYFWNTSAPVICVNDAIIVVESLKLLNPIYSLQKDGNPKHMVEPDGNTTLILQDTPGFSKDFYPDYPKRVLVHPIRDLGFDHLEAMAARMAVQIAKFMGCISLTMLCFDSLKYSDYQTFNPREGKSEETAAAKWYKISRSYLLRDLKVWKSYHLVCPGRVNG